MKKKKTKKVPLPKIKSCPFCKTKGQVEKYDYHWDLKPYYEIMCTNRKCKISVTTAYSHSLKTVIGYWNKREKAKK